MRSVIGDEIICFYLLKNQIIKHQFNTLNMITASELLARQVINFKEEEKGYLKWFEILRSVLSLPKEIIAIVDDYSTEYLSVKPWYIKEAFMNILTGKPRTYLSRINSVRKAKEVLTLAISAFDSSQFNKLCTEVKAEIVWISHQCYNQALLQGTSHMGCSSDMNVCWWEYGKNKCRCGSTEFGWFIDDTTNWMHFSIFEERYIGWNVVCEVLRYTAF